MSVSIDYIYRIVDKFSPQLRKMQTVSQAFNNDVNRTKQRLSGMRAALKSNIAMFISYGAAMYATFRLFKTGINLASDLTEVQNVVDTTFQNSASQIDSWSKKALEGFGLSELQAKKFTGTIGAMLKSTGISEKNLVSMSTKLAGLTGDFASFYNLEHEEAFLKIRAGISGETEPLKQLGINMSVANLEAYALTQGITTSYQSMTQAEQVMLRYNYLLKVSKDAQGDFSKTLADSYANQKRVLATRFNEKLANSMKELLPVLTNALVKMNAFIAAIDPAKISGFIMAIVKVVKFFGKLLKILKPLMPFIAGIIVAWKTYQGILLIVAAAQMILNAAMWASPTTWIIIAVGILIGLLYIAYKNLDKIKAVAKLAFGVAVQWLQNFLKSVWRLSETKAFKIITLSMQPIIETIKVIVENWAYVKKAFTDEGIGAGIKAIGKAILSGMLSPLQTILEVAAKIPKIGKWAQEGADKIKQFREGLFPEQEEELKKTKETVNKIKEEIKKTKDKAKEPINLSKTMEINKDNILSYKQAILKRRDEAAFMEKYVQQQRVVESRNNKQEMNATMNLKVYTEEGINVVPFNSTSDTGFNVVGN